MPSLNQAQFIDQAIDSVLGQDYPNIELIVVDGGSSDETRQILVRRAAQDRRLRWVAEPDTGPANALNKGFARVRGTVVGWLNSDDLYTSGAISRAVDAFQAHPSWLMVYGQGEHVDAIGLVIGRYPTRLPATPIGKFAEGCFICQPTVFFRRTMNVLLGKLDESLKTAFDFDYWLRAFSFFPDRIGFIDSVQAFSRLHDDCITLRQRRKIALEGMWLLKKYLGRAPKEWLLTYAIESLYVLRSSPEKHALREDLTALRGEVEQWIAPEDLVKLDRELGRLFDGNRNAA